MEKPLTYKQRLGIEALLLTNTVAGAANRIDVWPGTIYRWLKSETLRRVLNDVDAPTHVSITAARTAPTTPPPHV